MDQEKTEEQKQSTKDVSRFLLNLIVFGSGSLVMKMAWNLGLASLFPTKFPHIGFIHAFTWLTMLYIVSRVVSAGFMGEVEKTVSNLIEDLQDSLEALQSFISSNKSEKNQDYSDLN